MIRLKALNFETKIKIEMDRDKEIERQKHKQKDREKDRQRRAIIKRLISSKFRNINKNRDGQK